MASPSRRTRGGRLVLKVDSGVGPMTLASVNGADAAGL
ncbi:hypothetical protein [Azospirillum melinis]